MKVTVDFVKDRFKKFNIEIFGGRLPEIPVKLADSGKFLGQCVFKYRHLSTGRRECYDFELRINTRIELPEKVVEDTIIHEMIHYFIHLHQLEDTSAHGNLFKSLMQSINTTHGRHISITHNTTAEQREGLVNSKRLWHVIALVTTVRGHSLIKVLPRVIPKVVDFYTQLLRHPEIRIIDLYLHDNPYFNRFPTSTSFRLQNIDEKVFREHIVGAHRLKVEGNKLIQL